MSDKDVILWLNHKLYCNEIGVPRAWTTALTYIVQSTKAVSEFVAHSLVSLGGTATYFLLTVTIAKGSIGLFVPWTKECHYGPSKFGFGSHFLVLPWFGEC